MVNSRTFSSRRQLRRLTRKVASFGLRSTASTAHRRTIDWIEGRMRRIRGVRIRSDGYGLRRWQPLTRARRGPGRDLARAGRLRLLRPGRSASSIPIAGAIPYARPTGRRGRGGPLAYIPSDQEITAANARGRVVVRDVPEGSLPYALFGVVAWYRTPDTPSTGDYERPYLATDGPLAEEITAAGRAGATGIITVFDVPRRQIRGYFDPHRGTHFRVPGVFVGGAEGDRLKRLAAQGRSVRVVVRARADRVRTRNLIARLPGRSRQRIVLSTNTDGNTFVQENGNAGLIALARHLARLPRRCRGRTVEFAFGSAHLHISREGTDRYAARLDPAYDRGTVAFVFAVEHLGTREILPSGSSSRLRFTGRGELFAWFAGPSPALVNTARDAIQRRRLDRTALLRGSDVPVATRAPANCSFGGIGSAFHSRLIPTMAVISGPWSLWAPAFRERAISYARMRRQLLAIGDSLLALDDVSRAQIAGRYLAERERRRTGTPTCPHELPPERAPGPGS